MLQDTLKISDPAMSLINLCEKQTEKKVYFILPLKNS